MHRGVRRKFDAAASDHYCRRSRIDDNHHYDPGPGNYDNDNDGAADYHDDIAVRSARLAGNGRASAWTRR